MVNASVHCVDHAPTCERQVRPAGSEDDQTNLETFNRRMSGIAVLEWILVGGRARYPRSRPFHSEHLSMVNANDNDALTMAPDTRRPRPRDAYAVIDTA